jgi:hypothetical protein
VLMNLMIHSHGGLGSGSTNRKARDLAQEHWLRRDPPLSTLARLTQTLGVPVAKLLQEGDLICVRELRFATLTTDF